MKTRAELIDDIAWRRRPREAIFEDLRLSEVPPDCGGYILPISAVIALIDQRIAKKITENEVVEWAEFFECREGIDYHEKERAVITEAVFLLANPEINYPLTEENLRMIRDRCTKG